MWITVVSVTIAGLASFLIPLSVSATTRRNDRRRAERDPLINQDPARVVVRSRTWQWVIWRVLGTVFIVIGGFFCLVSFVSADTMDGPGPAITAIAIFIAGCGALILASSLRRARILASPEGLVVRRGFREERRIPLSEIAAIRPLANAYGGVDARDANGRRLFAVMGLSRGYAEFTEFLAERVIKSIQDAAATSDASGGTVPPWRGTEMSADWTMLPLGSRRGPEPIVRVRSAAGTAALHLDELRAVTNGEHGIAESLWSPEAYLCSPGSAAPSSAAGTVMVGVPDDALALLVGDLPQPAAVLRGAELSSFRRWVDNLPATEPTRNPDRGHGTEHQSSGLTSRQRDRKAMRFFQGGLSVVVFIVLFVVQRQLLVSEPLAVWLPTVAGVAYGSVLWHLSSRRDSRWMSNLTLAGWIVISWVLLGTKVVSGPAWFIAVIAGALAVTAILPRKPAPSAVKKLPLANIRPWSGSGIYAELVEHDVGRRSVPAVSVITHDATSTFLVADLAGHFDKEIGTAESLSRRPLFFLTRVGLASSDSIIGEVTESLPEGTLVLLHVAGDDTRLSAVFAAEDVATFEHWVRTLPEG